MSRGRVRGRRSPPPNRAAERRRRGRVRRAGWLVSAVLLAAGCAEDAPETIGREAFIETYIALRVAELTEPGEPGEDGEMISAEARERVLSEQGVTEEDLFGFVEVHGGDVDFMKAVWQEVEKRMEKMRNPPDTTGGSDEPHSHSIVAGGFELMS